MTNLTTEVSGEGIPRKGIQMKPSSEPSTHPMVIFQTNIITFMEYLFDIKSDFAKRTIAYINPPDGVQRPYKKIIYDYIDEKTDCIDLYASVNIRQAAAIPRILFEEFLTAEEIFSLFVDVEECCAYLRERNCQYV